MAAALAMMDEIHGKLPRRFNDHNTYTLGSIDNHNIVIACLPEGQYGTINAASVLTNVKRTFPSIRHGLMVGIGGAAPTKKDIRLGDIVVGTRIMQYDLGKILSDAEQASPGNRRKQLMESLEFDQIDSRRTTIKTAYSNTCSWFLKHPDYLAWLDPKKQSQHHGFLWLRGKPGAGKSIIMKFIYTKRKKTDIPMKAITISFFFNARGDLLEKSVSGIYRSLLLQLLEGFPDLQTILDDPDLIPRNQVTCPPLNILKDLFRSAISSLEKRALTCFVDALDECDEQQVKDMVEFFEEVAEQCVEDNVRFQVCFSSRHYPYIDIKSGIRLTLEGQEGHNEDLKRYISKHLRIQEPSLVDELTQMMLDKAAGVFLWVALVVDILNEENRHGRIALRTRLREVPNELSALFQDILTRDQDHVESLLLSILWILLAQRPLQAGEYYHALWSGLLLKGRGDSEMPPVNTSDASDCFNKCVISSSKGLAEITKAKKPTVQFIHESVRDFLIKDKGLYKLWPKLGADWESQGHEELRLCCNAYVFHESIWKALDEQRSAQAIKDGLLKQFPFLEYASQFVLGHADAAAHKITQQQFISEFPVSSWVRIFNIFEKHKVRQYSEGADVIYILADRGHPELIRMRLEVNPEIDGGGGRYRHPLLAAMAKGHKDSVIALLGLSSRIHNGTDITDGLKSKIDSVKPNHTPVSWACEEGHLAIAAFLLVQGAQVGVDDFARFVGNGNIEIVKMLLEKGADAAAANEYGRTPLHEASENSHLEIAKMLLEKEADAGTANKYGWTPLHEASKNGHLKIAKMLLEKGADAGAATKDGRTPLHEASKNGHLEIVKILR
ncbi:Ankyrin repeat [Fusarium oxysporum f. sp. vasinfectum]|nr:Ankyrin repeat [Fusarium oxysporum f. sp. vasinfectum]